MDYYFCDNEGHTKQVKTEESSPRCAICGAVMTYGRYSNDYEEFVRVKPGAHKTIDGKTYMLDKAITLSC